MALSAPAKAPEKEVEAKSAQAETPRKGPVVVDYVQAAFGAHKDDKGVEHTTLTGYIKVGPPSSSSKPTGKFFNFVVPVEKPSKDGSYPLRVCTSPADTAPKDRKWVTIGSMVEKSDTAENGQPYVSLHIDLKPVGEDFTMEYAGFRGFVATGPKTNRVSAPGIQFTRGDFDKFIGKTWDQVQTEKEERKAARKSQYAKTTPAEPSR